MSLHNIHVLVVDDSRVELLLATRVFNVFNIRVTAVQSAIEALDFLDLHHADVDLVVTDYYMPEMTGYDLLRELKESPILMDLPVVIACTDMIPERIFACIVGGARDYIMKPIKVADVPRLLSYI
ncbi:hypothetical protein BS78_07G091600 [Paspalum vaginatum]|nr:hypothetical protein BS78_07G091600 [Paspalum vaginatum]